MTSKLHEHCMKMINYGLIRRNMCKSSIKLGKIENMEMKNDDDE